MEHIRNIHTFNDRKYGVVPIWFSSPIGDRQDVVDIIRRVASKYKQVYYYWFEGMNAGKICTVCYVYFLKRDASVAADELYGGLDILKIGYVEDDAYINDDQPSKLRM